MRLTPFLPLLAVPLLALTACLEGGPRTGTPLPHGRVATAALVTAAGLPAGRARVTEVAGGLRVTIDARGLAPGQHGAHLHTVGRCNPPDFASAGGHWNPAGARHGSMNPQGPHAGDLPNLVIGPDGRGALGVTLAGATMDGLLDADGAALVIHAAGDDLMTDPSGNSGARIACGVLAAD
ncbi:superoxide dismutase family protein [uncultured Sphingomonas sp.]|uniref:superoxide dismutase family protein n=1 Tax=uncultured Sphingomonas sp. TaxID=158754 RepID=UPI0035C96932